MRRPTRLSPVRCATPELLVTRSDTHVRPGRRPSARVLRASRNCQTLISRCVERVHSAAHVNGGFEMRDLSFVWLEITGRCQLTCKHCYAESGPSDGVMLPVDWCRVIDEVAQLGGRMVQFIGGEPTLYRGLCYYSDDAAEHEAITKGRGSHVRTRVGITEALRRSIPLRVDLVDVQGGQRVEQARAELEALGVTEIGTDHLRQVGRGIRHRQPSIDQLCGHCARGKIAVSPSGDVWPCVFARWMPVGNVRHRTLVEILTGPEMATATAALADHFPAPEMPCVPKMCDPQCGPNCGPACNPSCWPTRTGPCGPKGGCVPNYGAYSSDDD